MFKTLANAWKLPDLRKKLIFTALILVIYRIGSAVTVPFVDTDAMTEFFVNSRLDNTVLGLYNAMSAYGYSRASILALGIQPYINASIIIQLLTVAIPALERLAKEEGEEGKKKIERITRYATVGLGVLLGFVYYTIVRNANVNILMDGGKGVWGAIVIISAFAAGSSVVMWLGEQITEHGIGNGISMILFANILTSLPQMIGVMSQAMWPSKWWMILIVAVVLLLLVVFIVFINDAERRIPIQYAKRVVGRKVYGGQNTNLPIKVSMSGVMPVIFASSIATIPGMIFTFYFNANGITPDPVTGLYGNFWYDYIFSPNSWVYIVAFAVLIFFFSWFYSTIQYDPVEIANNLKKNGGFIPGFRPGKPTADFIKKVINKILVFGALYLSVVALLPQIGGMFAREISALGIGGTSVMIVVGVALETVKALEAQMLMRHYKGFLD